MPGAVYLRVRCPIASTKNPISTALLFSRFEECDTACGRSGACEGLETVPEFDDVRLTEFRIVE